MIGKTTEYAIRALVYIYLSNGESKRPGVRDVAKGIDAPVPYIAKILHQLTKFSLLSSMKGRGGGFFLAEKQLTVSIFDVIQKIEGEGIFSKCALGLEHCCDDSPCPLHDEYKQIRTRFYQLVKDETLHSLSTKIKDGRAFLHNH